MAELYDEGDYEEEDTQNGRYLTFTLEENVYGVPIQFVTEIIGIQPITKVPETPDYIKGIINLRGKIVPLIDVRLKFGRVGIPYDERTCIVVVDVNAVSVGLIVDRVDDVLTIEEDKIAPPPENRLGFENRYIEGIGQVGDSVQLLLNVEKLLKHDEMEMVERISETDSAALDQRAVDG
ncbi:MAG: chemotaxis protein CheW [Clostridiales Family XIII bacterium]|jgi:purine-binding chemotaxis protein CheW|nr:chemotaxis protein CheW [Clostridiales Family XIII bacterium]